MPGRTLAVLGVLVLLGACRDRDPLQPGPDSAPPSVGVPPMRASSGTTLAAWVAIAPVESGDWEIGGVGDMTGDGKPDVVWQNRVTRQTGIWVMDGTTYTGWVAMPATESGNWQIGGVGDMTGDGWPDIVWQNRVTRQTGVWVMSGTTLTRWVEMPPAESGDWQIGGVADMNRDCKLDLVWQNQVTRQTGVWLMNGTTPTGWVAMSAAESGDWQIGGVADMTSDGNTDLVWQNRMTLQTRVWVMNGTTLTGWVAMPVAESGDWQIGGVTNMSGDGNTDIVWQNRATRQTGAWIMGDPVSLPAPPEARFKTGYTAFQKAPYGMKGATPWLAVVHTGQAGVPSWVEIDHIQLWAEIDGVSSPVAQNAYDNGTFGGELRNRAPWFCGAWEKMPGTTSGGVLTIRPSDRPEKVWHPYLESWPQDRVDISRATRVWFVTRLRLHGPVAVQAGIDYYEHLGYPSVNPLEEGSATDWEYRQEEWITMTTERSTEVVGPIELSPPSQNGTYPVGSTITAAFVLRNADDDRIRLDEVGIDTRRVAPDDPYCDPRKREWAAGFGWALNVDLLPGGTFRHPAQWTPPAAGDYCIRVVEKRPGVPDYQQPYASSPYQTIRVR